MATHSSILPWRIPRTEEPNGLQSTGSQRVRHDGVLTHAHTHTHTHTHTHSRLLSIDQLLSFPANFLLFHYYDTKKSRHCDNLTIYASLKEWTLNIILTIATAKLNITRAWEKKLLLSTELFTVIFWIILPKTNCIPLKMTYLPQTKTRSYYIILNAILYITN